MKRSIFCVGLSFTAMAVALWSAPQLDWTTFFRNPPNVFRPLQIIHGFDNLGSDASTIQQRLQALKGIGVGGLVVNVSFRNYLREEQQWQLFLTGLHLAEEAGFLLWLYDEEGYPSGAAGGLVLAQNPDFEAIGLVRIQDELGRPHYEVQRMYEGTHCTENVYQKRRYINILDPRAVRAFISLTHDAYAQRVPNIGKRFRALFTDEPSLMTTYIRPPEGAKPALPWVVDLPDEFRRRKGYDLSPHLDSLFTDVGDYQRVRCDFYEVVAQLIAERYFGQIQDWARKHGLASSGHLLAEEKLLWHAMYYGDLIACLRRMDIPGCDMLTSDPRVIVVGNGFLAPKFAASAAHLEGRNEVMSETSDFMQRMGIGHQKRRAWLPEMKATAALQFLLGVTTITSYYAHPFEGEQERTEYAHYCTYVGRLGAMLNGAKHDCDIAVLYPIAGVWANFYPTALSMYQPHPNQRLNEIDDQFAHLCRLLLQHQLDFDIVDEQGLQEAKVTNSGFQIAAERYKALIVPTTDAIHLSTLQKIAELQRKGVLVLAIGKTPQHAASRNEDSELVRQLAANLFRDESWLPVADQRLVQRLRQAGCGVLVEPSLPDLLVARYQRVGRPIYFLVNISTQPITVTLSLPGWQRATLWVPENGSSQPLQGRREGNALLVPLSVPALDSLFVVSE